MTDGSGRVTFASLTIDKVGTYTLTASASGYTSVVTTPVTINPGPPAKAELVSGSPQSARITTVFAQSLVARATDAAGNPVGGTSVLFNAPASGASGIFTADSLNQINVTSGSDGLASAQFKANAIVGSYSVTATVGTISATFFLTNTATAGAASAPAATANRPTGRTAAPATTSAASTAPDSQHSGVVPTRTSAGDPTTSAPASAPDQVSPNPTTTPPPTTPAPST